MMRPVDTFITTVIFDIGEGSIVAMLALGIVLIFRTSGVLNFAQAGTGALGAYVMFSVADGRSVYLAIAAGVIAAAVAGIASFAIVRSIHTRHQALTSAVATLAIAILLQQIIRIGWGSETAQLFPNPFGTGAFTIGTIPIDYLTIGEIATAAVLGLGMSVFLLKTRTGTMVRAISDNPVSARLCGANLLLLVAGVWAFAGGLAAASAFFAAQTIFEPSFMDLYLLSALIAAVIGGLHSLRGAFFGAIALQVIGDLFSAYAPLDIQPYTQTFLVLLLIAILVFAPKRWLGHGIRRTV